MKERIEHRGVVDNIIGETVIVRIVQSSACGGCDARKLCQSSESKEKIIECKSNGVDYKIGDDVMVYGSLSMGRNAVILAFVIPLILVVIWMFAAIRVLGLNELVATGGMVGILAVYYIILKLIDSKISKSFEFWIEQIV